MPLIIDIISPLFSMLPAIHFDYFHSMPFDAAMLAIDAMFSS